jgi:predicted lipoprotein
MRLVRWFIAIVVIACVCWLFPLFHVVPLKTATAEKVAAAFDATEFAETFWTNQLLTSLDRAVPTGKILPAIQSDPAAAKKKFSRSVGLSDNYFYFLRGEGKIISVSDDEVSMAVTENSTNAEIVLETGLVFGDAVRDGTGLLNASDYANSQDFNDISAALNHIVETTILKKLHEQAKAGAKIIFAGCAEVDDESTDLKPLKVIPIQAEIQ